MGQCRDSLHPAVFRGCEHRAGHEATCPYEPASPPPFVASGFSAEAELGGMSSATQET